MVKHGKKRRRGFRAIPFQVTRSLSTLADDAAISIATLGAAFTDDEWIISVDANVNIEGVTPGEGPCLFGYSHSDLSDAEIVEKLVAETASVDDLIQMERARRPVRQAGSYSGQLANAEWNNGNPKRTKCGFRVGDGFFLDFWVQNKSGAVLTTGVNVVAFGTIFVRRMG